MNRQGFDWVFGGLLLATALAFPILFHAVGLGSMFLPMFIPVSLAGFLLPPAAAISVGFLAPLVSAFLTGMPPLHPPIAVLMCAELTVVTGTISGLRRFRRLPTLTILALALAAERLVLLGGVLLLSRWWQLPPRLIGVSALAQGIPGIILILAVIPPLTKRLEASLKRIVIYE